MSAEKMPKVEGKPVGGCRAPGADSPVQTASLPRSRPSWSIKVCLRLLVRAANSRERDGRRYLAMHVREELIKAAESLKGNPAVAKGIELYDAQVKMLHDGARARRRGPRQPKRLTTRRAAAVACSPEQRNGAAHHGHAQQGQGDDCGHD